MSDHINERNKRLDLLKVLAIFAVVNLHSGIQGFTVKIIEYMCGFAKIRNLDSGSLYT